MTVSTGTLRRDHGEVDRQKDGVASAPARRSRLPSQYASPAMTPWSFEVVPGTQTIDLEIGN